jgi:hypothetical protein
MSGERHKFVVTRRYYQDVLTRLDAFQARAQAPLHPYFGGFNSLASHPWTSELMGSLDTTAVSTRPHFWHSNVR